MRIVVCLIIKPFACRLVSGILLQARESHRTVHFDFLCVCRIFTLCFQSRTLKNMNKTYRHTITSQTHTKSYNCGYQPWMRPTSWPTSKKEQVNPAFIGRRRKQSWVEGLLLLWVKRFDGATPENTCRVTSAPVRLVLSLYPNSLHTYALQTALVLVSK